MEFTCPACNVPLLAHKLEDIRLWKCMSCRGFMISLPIAKRGLHQETFRDIWKKLFTGVIKWGRSCPGCRQPLSVVGADGGDGTVMIDVCRTCQILWFDDEEFSDLPRAGTRKVAKKLTAEEERVFSAFKRDQLKRRSFLVKLLEDDVLKEFELDSLFGDFFDR